MGQLDLQKKQADDNPSLFIGLFQATCGRMDPAAKVPHNFGYSPGVVGWVWGIVP